MHEMLRHFNICFYDIAKYNYPKMGTEPAYTYFVTLLPHHNIAIFFNFIVSKMNFGASSTTKEDHQDITLWFILGNLVITIFVTYSNT